MKKLFLIIGLVIGLVVGGAANAHGNQGHQNHHGYHRHRGDNHWWRHSDCYKKCGHHGCRWICR